MESQILKTTTGVFNGIDMVGDDGRTYEVPRNYASKSRLVEGDKLKRLVIGDGSIIYKQVEPAPRTKILAEVFIKNDHSFNVVAESKTYRVLRESARYFKVVSGDNVVVIIPEHGECEWAVIDAVVGEIESTETELNT